MSVTPCRDNRRVSDRLCIFCGSTFEPTTPWNKFCSDRCRFTSGRTSPIYVIDCEWCGKPSTKRRPLGRFCSDRCRQRKQDSDKDRNRDKNRQRRLKGRGGGYKLADIAARDGYCCHICRKPVDMSLPGTHKRGPTIDHLIPLSQGGPDTEANVALAHRSCNCARGARGTVQLRLAS